eukprot:9504163-Pyramimonas_sp.AAC.3
MLETHGSLRIFRSASARLKSDVAEPGFFGMFLQHSVLKPLRNRRTVFDGFRHARATTGPRAFFVPNPPRLGCCFEESSGVAFPSFLLLLLPSSLFLLCWVLVLNRAPPALLLPPSLPPPPRGPRGLRSAKLLPLSRAAGEASREGAHRRPK